MCVYDAYLSRRQFVWSYFRTLLMQFLKFPIPLPLLPLFGHRRNTLLSNLVLFALVLFPQRVHHVLFLGQRCFFPVRLAPRPFVQLLQLRYQHNSHAFQELDKSIFGELQVNAEIVGLHPEVDGVIHSLGAYVFRLEVELLHAGFHFA